MSNLKSVTDLEQEIEALEAGLIKPVEKRVEEPVVEEVVPEDPEEASFKKRYSDLRRSSQKTVDELKSQVEDLRSRLDEALNNTSMPSSVEEAKVWAEQNPKAAEIIRALAREQVRTENPKEDLKKVREEVSRIKQEAKIRKAHPDFEDIISDDVFHDWANAQPQKIQDLIFGNDADDVIWAINQYKEKTKPSLDLNKETARAVTKTKTAEVPGPRGKAFSESQVDRMSAAEYEANEEAIQASIKAGTFEYDLSGAAR